MSPGSGGEIVSDRLTELLSRPSLSDVIEVFFAHCVDDTFRAPNDFNFLMIFLEKKWGRYGERAPDYLKEFLKDVSFIGRGPLPYSEKIDNILFFLSTGGVISWIANTDYYYIDKQLAEKVKENNRLTPEIRKYLGALAAEYVTLFKKSRRS